MNYSVPQFLLAFGLALFAGLSTGFGGLFILKADKTNTKFLSAALGFSAGVMIYVSLFLRVLRFLCRFIYATGSKKRALMYAFLSGLAEPAGALIGGLLLLPFLNNFVMGIVFCIIAGIMIYISFDELLPSAEKYGEHHTALYGVI